MIKLLVISLIILAVPSLADVDINDTLDKQSLSGINIFLCPFKNQPWECARSQAGRVLDSWYDVLKIKNKELLVEADKNLVKVIQSRGFPVNKINEENKPSNLMRSVEMGVQEVGDYVSEAIEDLVLGPSTETTETTAVIAEGKSDNNMLMKQLSNFNDTNLAYPIGALINGRGHGVQRGKKKKKKKAIMKVLILAAVLKGKIELLLKLLGTHLQIKFLIIAALALVVNVARFWIDLKNKQHPQKVIYYEHANHQHHYDEHSDDWGGGGSSGGYWKRSFDLGQQGEQNRNDNYYQNEENGYRSLEDLFPNVSSKQQQQHQQNVGGDENGQLDAHQMAYNNQAPFL